MQVILLAAGYGKRMRPLSLSCPKPLLYCGKHRLIEYHLYKLGQTNFSEVFINVNYRSQDFIQVLGNGSNYGVKISYLFEAQPLEAGGTLINAIPKLQPQPFLVISSDIYTDFDFATLKSKANISHAHLLLTPPKQHSFSGDFDYQPKNNTLSYPGKYTYANIGVFNPEIFTNWPKSTKIPLINILKPNLKQITATAISSNTTWHNIGNPTQLQQLDKQLKSAINKHSAF